MFRILKLVAFGLIGYALYEFFRGLTGGSSGPARQGAGQGQRPSQSYHEELRPGDRSNAAAGNMHFSGPGEGQVEETADLAGTSTPHIVGRGVVRR